MTARLEKIVLTTGENVFLALCYGLPTVFIIYATASWWLP